MISYSAYTDVELLAGLNQGDHQAFTEIYNRYWQVLYLHAHKMLKDEDEAMDVVQDIFSVLWNRRADQVVHTNAKAYLYIAVRNQTLKVINKGRLKSDFLNSVSQYLEEGVSQVEEHINYKEFAALLEKEISALPPKMQEIFSKSRDEGLSYKQIAEELGVTEHTVRTTIHRALNILRAKMLVSMGTLLTYFLSK